MARPRDNCAKAGRNSNVHAPTLIFCKPTNPSIKKLNEVGYQPECTQSLRTIFSQLTDLSAGYIFLLIFFSQLLSNLFTLSPPQKGNVTVFS